MPPDLSLSQVKITPRHLERKAVISIRQSSPKQVREHLDSQLTQRTLIRRAEHLGWPPERIEVFDGDLGQSAAGMQERDDFKALAAESLFEKYQAASRLSIKRVIATYTKVSLVVGNSSSSLLNRRLWFNQAKVLSTTHRCGKTAKPFCPSACTTDSRTR